MLGVANFLNLWRRNVEDRSLTRESLPSVMLPDGTAEVSTRGSLALADVFACVRVLADGAVMCPLHVYRRTTEGRERVSGGNTPDLLGEPSPGVTQPAFVSHLIAHLALWGEAFIGKYLAPDETVHQLGLLPPDMVTVELKGGEPVYTFRGSDGKEFENLTRDDVIHVRGLSLDGVRGASPIKCCREAVGLSKSLSDSASSLWSSGGVPAGVLTIPPGPASDDQAEQLAKRWRERHGGPEGRGKVAVLTGEVQFKPVAMPMADAEFIDTRKLSTAEIARIFRIPPWMIGAASGDSLTYSNTEGQASAFVRFSLGPLLRLIEEALSTDPDLFGPGTYCRFAVDGLLRADSAGRAAFYTAALNTDTGWMTRSEVRALEDLPRETPEPEEANA